ncbi:hypothetical protein CRENBAI_006888 [Crenichthys baileyi]|uniref:Uncharacterized protein n=1 Tax=Crenichthys baileyi TaxID=28760 RepID=A0AAV9RBD4_9TELE
MVTRFQVHRHVLPPPPPPRRDAGVSAELGDPTDEELLEAKSEHEASTQPQDPPEPATRQDVEALLRRDPPPPADGAVTLPESWRAALSSDQQEWISRTLFGRDRTGRRPRLTSDLNLRCTPLPLPLSLTQTRLCSGDEEARRCLLRHGRLGYQRG